MGSFNKSSNEFSRFALSKTSSIEAYSRYQTAEVSKSEAEFLSNEFMFPCTESSKAILAKELTEDLVFSGSNGQNIGGLHLNRASSNLLQSKVLVVSNGFLTDSTQIDSKIRAYWLAKYFPDYQLVIYDQPSHGLSDTFTKTQRQDYKKGDMQNVGEEQYAAITGYLSKTVGLDNIATLVMKAESYGARQGLDVIKASLSGGVVIKSLVGLEIPGTVDGRRFDILASYFGYEYLRSSFYDADWLASYKTNFVEYLQTFGSLNPPSRSIVTRDKRMMKDIFYNSCLGHGTGFDVLKHIINSGVEVIRIVGEMSRIDRLSTAIEEQSKIADEVGSTFALWSLKHDSHGGTGMISRARMAASLCQYAMQSSDTATKIKGNVEFEMADIQKGIFRIPKSLETI